MDNPITKITERVKARVEEARSKFEKRGVKLSGRSFERFKSRVEIEECDRENVHYIDYCEVLTEAY